MTIEEQRANTISAIFMANLPGGFKVSWQRREVGWYPTRMGYEFVFTKMINDEEYVITQVIEERELRGDQLRYKSFIDTLVCEILPDIVYGFKYRVSA